MALSSERSVPNIGVRPLPSPAAPAPNFGSVNFMPTGKSNPFPGSRPPAATMDLFGGRMTNGARMLVFTPRNHDSICLRPNKFNFNDGLLPALENAQSFTGAVTAGFGGNLSKAIIADAQGINYDTRHLDMLWSFVLVFDRCGVDRSSVMPGNKTRVTLKGFFLDEPIAPQTLMTTSPVWNRECPIMFTCDSMMAIRSEMSQRGAITNINNTNNIDVVHRMAESLIPQNQGSLFLTDTSTIAKCYAANGGGTVMGGASAALSNTAGERGYALGPTSRSPRHQLLALARNLDSAASAVNRDFTIFGEGDSIISGNDPFDKFIEGVNQNQGAARIGRVMQGLDPQVIMTVGGLQAMIPSMTIIPCRIPPNSGFDVRSQGDVNPQNIFSSMVASIVASLANDYQLSKISFRATSWSPNHDPNGQFNLLDAGTMIGDVGIDLRAQLSNAVANFRNEIILSLYPILLNGGGEFDMTVFYDNSTSTIVDLNFLEYATLGGFYEVHNRLGGLINPSIGSSDVFNNNANQYDWLLSHIAARTTGGQPANFVPWSPK